MTRRSLLASSLAGGAAAALAAAPGSSPAGVCLTLCNHWSYIGIGWQLGLESNVLSVVDAMEMSDRPPFVKTCINLDARAYELIAERFPEVAARLRKYLAEGKVELIGGTYGQPMGTMFSGESNIRQIVVGREVIRKALGYEVVTFLEEEEFTHPQVPQILVGAGYRYASLAQLDTWGNAGVPSLEVNSFHWKGKDGTAIPSTPKNSLFSVLSVDTEKLASSPAYRKLRESGQPLILVWEEFGWESPETPSYLTAPEKYKKVTERFPVEFVTLREYMDKYGRSSHPVYFDMDSWNKLLTWGLGGDQLRIEDRAVEALLLAAERFDAIASKLGAASRADELDLAWRDLLASQSHDAGLCEYSRWQGNRMAPLERSEDFHNFTWGAIGYNHLDSARKRAEPVLARALAHLSRQRKALPRRSELQAVVFNPCPWERTAVVETGRLYPLPANTRDVIVRDREGRAVPSQLVKPLAHGVANVAFLARNAPGMGYDSYSLEPVPESAPRTASGLRVDERNLALENEYLKLRLDPATGALASLIDKRTGFEMLALPFPVFEGAPNPDSTPVTDFGRRSKPVPERFDSSQGQAEIDWVERGPLRASVRARHEWPLLRFETRVNLCASVPHVEVISRVLSSVPPLSDSRGPRQRFPVEITNGYWLSFAPAFPVASFVRDYPLAVEPARHAAFQALTFLDLVAGGRGLLLLHPGTQYFKRGGDGKVSNLIMREWESHFNGEYGWPRYAEYRHWLMPHGAEFDNAARVKASTEFSQRLIARVCGSGGGTLPLRRSFLEVSPGDAQLLAFRRKVGGGCELRVLETNGRQAGVNIHLGLPVASAAVTDLLGNRVEPVSHGGGLLKFQIQPWQVRTIAVD